MDMETTSVHPDLHGSILGTRVLRTEDPALLTGARRYLDDLDIPGKLHAAFARSRAAHALVRAVHVEDARAIDGVVEVLTADELGIDPIQGFVTINAHFAQPPLATDRVRFVGEPIAVVIATSKAAAEDGASAIWADYDPLPVTVDPEVALGEEAPVIFPEHGTNRSVVDVSAAAVDPAGGNDDAVVVRGRYVNQRMAVVAIEPNGCAAVPAAADGERPLTFYASTQMPHPLRTQLAHAVGLNEADVRIIAPQVGGGFGGKIGLCREYAAVAAAALSLGRPVTWTPTRSDDLVSMPHARAQIQYAELGCRPDGTFTGLRVRLVGDSGAYPGLGAFIMAGTKRMSHGTYRLPAIQFDAISAVTNTVPTGAFRGAGRPEATALVERLVDQAAIELRIDPIELRKRNLLPDDSFPFATLTGLKYDSGAYETALDRAVAEVGYEALRADQAVRRERGDRVQLGIGVATYVEITAGGVGEFGAVSIDDNGEATILAGTFSHGQGHETAFAMLVHDRTGIPISSIRLIDGDTDLIRSGFGTGGSRSLQLGGSAVAQSAGKLVDKARKVAAHLLEADVADIVVDRATGTIGVTGSPAQALPWATLAQRIGEVPPEVYDDGDGAVGLAAQGDFDQQGATFPFGAHIAVVEVDLDTGATRVLRHVAVDDCGTVLNPLLVEGQQHGGIASGIGQALYEEVRYDQSGNPQTTTLADYGIVTAAELPRFEPHSTETPTPYNPLGAKGIGEAATIGSTPAVQNAVIDAVSHLGIRHIDLPCTPERVWRAVRDAERGSPPSPWREPPAVFDEVRRTASPIDDEGWSDAEAI